ncbi:FERM, ARHGEF and pleckstrin domain-containing protein 2-like [Choloepus didactylus]|uniref:FERM, ARHGEF and pleckstrin domain-containing protein 2-like n=1 Tax=Choloepus didactylus TaxID=27675 RepID=UPI00189DA820|nr:FERM, ARHGEF and pleckstrin domain-containing protein 2-like [Choloepus didactylus]
MWRLCSLDSNPGLPPHNHPFCAQLRQEIQGLGPDHPTPPPLSPDPAIRATLSPGDGGPLPLLSPVLSDARGAGTPKEEETERQVGCPSDPPGTPFLRPGVAARGPLGQDKVT